MLREYSYYIVSKTAVPWAWNGKFWSVVHGAFSLHSAISARCIELGVDVKVIAQWQGHQDGGKLILGMYSHVRNVHAEGVAKKLV